ncbi:lipopolysaccharide biosynthesis protein [Dyella sp. M7H15-1]|uniref:lipopolysaccharide biosynthesis protein n=1 Tax=Dyella sp. M7H15-1 TaxID=2501295 RepID=UPI00100510BB|nr:lipopolysaccharide biosynthesis protein [Dyella sp. M7H15-1]QAU25142.1 lipopolysaccharide biosynthesis protein [Dyella sp. M7H15-1]
MLGLRIVTQAATLILLSRLLAPATYGDYASAASLAVVLGTLPSMGSGYILLARAAVDKTTVAHTWRYAWPLTLVLGLFLLVIYAGFGRYITGNTGFSVEILVFLGMAELIFNPLTMLFSFIMQGCEKVATSQFLQWLPLLLRAIAVLACFNLPQSDRLTGFAGLQLIASFLGCGAGLIVVRRLVSLTWRPRFMTRQELRLGASYAAMLLVAYNPSELDKIVAVRSLGAHGAGIYTAASRILGAFATPIAALLLAAQPRLLRHSKDTHLQNRRLIGIIGLIALAWGIAGTFLFASFHPLIPWLLGNAYAETGKLVPWLAITMPFLTLRMAAGGILVALGKPLERLLFELSGAMFLITGIVCLTPILHTIGLIIAVIGSELSMMIIGWWRIQKNVRRLDFACID